MPQGRECILFVDDEEALAYLGHALLTALGYEVVALTSSLEALAVFQAAPDHFDLVITDRDRSWNLKNFFPDFPDAETIRSGNTGRAVWSPDGHTIAFFAAPAAIGKTGLNRIYVEYNLYLMDADQPKPKAVLDNIYFPFVIKWSPDSNYVAFIGQYGSSKQAGLWLYSMKSDSILNIAEGKFQDILWNTDNRSLTAIHCDDKHYCSQIEEYDLSSILQ